MNGWITAFSGLSWVPKYFKASHLRLPRYGSLGMIIVFYIKIVKLQHKISLHLNYNSIFMFIV